MVLYQNRFYKNPYFEGIPYVWLRIGVRELGQVITNVSLKSWIKSITILKIGQR